MVYCGTFGLGYGTGGWSGMIFMGLFWIAVIAAIIWLVIKLSQGQLSGNKTAEEILKERYARGELSEKEYDQKLREVRK
ncbi:MAG: SHOCT domain-containing protein [Nanoarchaeota archaeon]